jgi:hypothetical protein
LPEAALSEAAGGGVEFGTEPFEDGLDLECPLDLVEAEFGEP